MNTKNLIYILIVLLSPLSTVFSQQSEGYVYYENKVDLGKLRAQYDRPFPADAPQYRYSHFILHFNQTESLYNRQDDPSNDIDSSPSFRGSKQRNIIYKNHVEQEGIETRTLLSKKFLVTGDYKVPEWKITSESKNVGSFYCQKAIFKDSIQTIEAWFTPMIPIMSGPDQYVGLPGLVLHVDIDNGSNCITATDIFLEELEENVLIKPTEGKKINREKFEALQKEKKEEMQMNRFQHSNLIKRRG